MNSDWYVYVSSILCRRFALETLITAAQASRSVQLTTLGSVATDAGSTSSWQEFGPAVLPSAGWPCAFSVIASAMIRGDVDERLLLFCIASGTDWTRAGITGATARNMIEDALRASLAAIAASSQGGDSGESRNR